MEMSHRKQIAVLQNFPIDLCNLDFVGPDNAGLCGGLEVEFLLCTTNNLLPGRSIPIFGA